MAYDLLPYERLPLWVRDNPYISHGYRVEIGWKNSCHSLCHLHNETMNIWTHFIAFALILVLLVVTLIAMSPHGVDRLNMGLVELAKVRQAFTAAQPPAFICPLDQPHSPSAPSLPSSLDHSQLLLTGTNCSVEEEAAVSGAHLSFVSNLEQLFASPSSYLPTPVTEVVDRLQHHLPSVQRLTRTLRDQADSIASIVSSGRSSLSSSLPLTSFTSTQTKFLSFLTRVESHLSSLHSTVSSTLTLDNALHLKQLIHDNVGGFTQHLTAKQVDLVRVVKAMMAEFVRSIREEAAQDEGGVERPHSLSPFDMDDEGLGLAVRVRKWAGLGDGDVFFVMQSSRPSSSQLVQPSQSLQAQEHARRKEWEEDVQLHFYLPRWPLTVFMVTALLCLLFSALFHCFQAVSEPIAVLFQALDYCGITLLIAGSNVPVIYYGFYCSPLTSAFYNSTISALAGVCFLITILPSCRSLRFRTLKTLLFITLGFSGVIPLVHLILDLGYIHFIVYYLAAMGAFYVGGAVVYLFHIPERWWPGKFDLWMSSHQIWHLMIVAAVLTHYLGVIHLFEWRFHHVCKE